MASIDSTTLAQMALRSESDIEKRLASSLILLIKEVGAMRSRIEETEKKSTDLENRLFMLEALLRPDTTARKTGGAPPTSTTLESKEAEEDKEWLDSKKLYERMRKRKADLIQKDKERRAALANKEDKGSDK